MGANDTSGPNAARFYHCPRGGSSKKREEKRSTTENTEITEKTKELPRSTPRYTKEI
jgi:hypothetical protein